MTIDADLLEDCSGQFRAGVREFYIVASCNVTAGTIGTDHSITAFTMVSMAEFFKFQPKDNMSSILLEEGANGTFSVTVKFSYEGLDKTKLHELQNLIDERKVIVVAVMNNSAGSNPQAFVLGWDEELEKAAQLEVFGSGGVEEDLIDGTNLATITMRGRSAEWPREFVGTIDYNSGTVTLGS